MHIYMLSKFKNQRLLDQGWVIQTLNELSLDGWTNGANLKKLSGFSEKVYSVRGTIKGRLVFTVGRYQGVLSLFLLDILPNHDIPTHNTYDEQVRLVQNMIRQEALPLEELDTQATRLALTTTEPVPVYEFNHNGLILSDEQNKLLKIDLEGKALLVNGPPGSGKTSSLFIMLVERIEQGTANEPKCYLYISRSKELAHFMREEWRRSGYEQRARENDCTVRFSYAHCSFYNEVDEHFFYYPMVDKDRLNHARTIQKETPLIIGVTKTKAWFDGKLNELRKRPGVDSNIQIDFESFLQEKGILCGYSREAYLSDEFGKRNSLFKPSQKKMVYDLYEEYLVFVATEINDRQVFDLSLCRMEQEQGRQYDLILVDETQDFSLGQLKDFRRLSPKNQIVMSIDSNQDLAKGLSLRTHIKGLFTRDNTCFVTSVSLVKSFRCPGLVIELANCLITLKNKITGGVSDKDEYSNFQMQSKDYGAGDVLWVNSQSLSQSQELLSSFIDTEIVVVAYADKKQEAEKRFPNYTVFTPEDIKGLEYPCVITYHLLDTALFKEANSLLKKAGDKVNIHRAKPEEAQPRFAPDFNGVFTAITRAQKALVIIENEVYELTHLMASLREVVDRGNQKPPMTASHVTVTPPTATTIDDWKKQVNNLASQGKNRMADEVFNQRLKETLGLSFAEYIKKDELSQNISSVQNASITRPPNRKERKKVQHESIKPLASEDIKKKIQSLPPGVPKGQEQLINKASFLLKKFSMSFLNAFLISEPVVQYRMLPLPEFNNQTLLDVIISDEDKRPVLEQLLTEKRTLALKFFNDEELKIIDTIGVAATIANIPLTLIRKFKNDLSFLFSQFQYPDFLVNHIISFNGSPLLTIAAEMTNKGLFVYLLKIKGIDVNKKDKDGVTALYIACRDGHTPAIKLLLAYPNIDINHELPEDGTTSFFMACANEHADVVRLLLDHKDIDINKVQKNGATPLYATCRYGDVKTAKLLLTHKDIAINQEVQQDGTTPLYVACLYGHVDTVKLLLDQQGIEINKDDQWGITPLHLACQKGYSSIVQLLLNSNKVDLSHQNDEGETAFDLAFVSKNDSVIVQCFSYAKNKGLSLTALMSSKTQNIARGWWGAVGEYSGLGSDRFFSSSFSSDLKQFIQHELKTADDKGMGLTSI